MLTPSTLILDQSRDLLWFYRLPMLFRQEAILFPDRAAALREWTLRRVETLPSLSRNHN
jgi:hypothetical protein